MENFIMIVDQVVSDAKRAGLDLSDEKIKTAMCYTVQKLLYALCL